MSETLQLYILALTDGSGHHQAIPFWWDGSGDASSVVRHVLEENGECVLGEDEKLCAIESPDDFEPEILGPWGFQEISILNAAERLPMIAIPFSLAEKCDEAKEKRIVPGTLHLYVGRDIGLHFDGYEARGTDAIDAETAAVEVWNGELRILAWPDRSNEEPSIVEMEGARAGKD